VSLASQHIKDSGLIVSLSVAFLCFLFASLAVHNVPCYRLDETYIIFTRFRSGRDARKEIRIHRYAYTKTPLPLEYCTISATSIDPPTPRHDTCSSNSILRSSPQPIHRCSCHIPLITASCPSSSCSPQPPQQPPTLRRWLHPRAPLLQPCHQSDLSGCPLVGLRALAPAAVRCIFVLRRSCRACSCPGQGSRGIRAAVRASCGKFQKEDARLLVGRGGSLIL
jgi:hypothetical protein